MADSAKLDQADVRRKAGRHDQMQDIQDLKYAGEAVSFPVRQTVAHLKSELLTLEDPDEIAVLTRAVKSRKDSIQSYVEGGRQDLADKEQAEIDVIQRYLPKPLTDEEARDAIAAIVSEVGASTKKDLGKVMKEVRSRYPGQVDGKLASTIAGELLS